jgi:hypothetical protein
LPSITDVEELLLLWEEEEEEEEEDGRMEDCRLGRLRDGVADVAGTFREEVVNEGNGVV